MSCWNHVYRTKRDGRSQLCPLPTKKRWGITKRPWWDEGPSIRPFRLSWRTLLEVRVTRNDFQCRLLVRWICWMRVWIIPSRRSSRKQLLRMTWPHCIQFPWIQVWRHLEWWMLLRKGCCSQKGLLRQCRRSLRPTLDTACWTAAPRPRVSTATRSSRSTVPREMAPGVGRILLPRHQRRSPRSPQPPPPPRSAPSRALPQQQTAPALWSWDPPQSRWAPHPRQLPPQNPWSSRAVEMVTSIGVKRSLEIPGTKTFVCYSGSTDCDVFRSLRCNSIAGGKAENATWLSLAQTLAELASGWICAEFHPSVHLLSDFLRWPSVHRGMYNWIHQLHNCWSCSPLKMGVCDKCKLTEEFWFKCHLVQCVVFLVLVQCFMCTFNLTMQQTDVCFSAGTRTFTGYWTCF